MGLITKILIGPLASFFMLMIYAVIMSTFLGFAWIKENKVLTTEYVVILSGYYTLCLLGHTFRNRKKDVA